MLAASTYLGPDELEAVSPFRGSGDEREVAKRLAHGMLGGEGGDGGERARGDGGEPASMAAMGGGEGGAPTVVRGQLRPRRRPRVLLVRVRGRSTDFFSW